MLPPKPRLLSVIETVEQKKVNRSSKTDQRYPRRRGLERAAQSFVIYLLVAGQFSEYGERRLEAGAAPPAGALDASPE